MTTMKWRRLLVTGAAGRLGRELRSGLRDLAQQMRITDINGLTPDGEGEEVVCGDLADMASVQAMLAEVDVVVHLGAVMPQAPWEAVLQANIVGTFNVFEAARQAGAKRIVFASSHHAVGMYDRAQKLDSDSPARPGNLYGLSKAFGEDLARMYYDKHGIETVCVRIGSCFEKPTDERMLSTWLSPADMVELCRCCLVAPSVGYSVVYGVSANSLKWWSNGKADFLGYSPRDSADSFAQEISHAALRQDPGLTTDQAAPPSARAQQLQGGRFTDLIP